MKFIRDRIWLILLLTALLVTLAIPSTREAHVLCFRLVFPCNGKTFVRGQPEGCILYTIPNVQFSEKYRAKLVAAANRSPDDFALATVTREWAELRFPPAQSWTNHPLQNWAAFTCCYLASAYRTNADQIQAAFEAVKNAQAVQPENGALWLSEAILSFHKQDNQAALDALQLAARKTNWITGSSGNFQCLSKRYHDAGLSQLDAAIEANWIPDGWNSMIQGYVKVDVTRLMVNAVDSTNDDEFLKLLTLLVELRKAEWVDGGAKLRNSFRWFNPGDELCEAMRKRLGREAENSSDYEIQRSFKDKIFRDYLALQNQNIVGRFWGQADAAVTEKNLRREMQDGFPFRQEMLAVSRAILSGASAAFFHYFLCTELLLLLPLVWLRQRGEAPGSWPKRPAFWALAAASVAVGVAIGGHFFFNLGLFSRVGLMEGPSHEINPLTKSILLSSLLCGAVFLVQLLMWKTEKKMVLARWDLVLIGFIYVFAVIAMAFSRSQLADIISAGT